MATELNVSMKMAELLEMFPSLLGVFSRMGFSFGYGDATVAEVCSRAGCDAGTFLLICRVCCLENYIPSQEDLQNADLKIIAGYLRASHKYYVDVALKDIASGISRMTLPCADETQRVFWKFFADFKDELQSHFDFEENVVFPNMGEADVPEEDHSGVEETLEDLKNLVMNHLPAEADQSEAFSVLLSINSLQADIHKHILLEETALEGRKRANAVDSTLSEREKEVLVCVAEGLINKEIADRLSISVHTVVSHRKNITQKTGIKTIAGLTVYALLNNLLDPRSVR